MARIKCRYSIPYCEYENRHERLDHDDYWWCDSSDYCDGKYTKPKDAEVINPTCTYCEYIDGEFEKEVKSYEYYDGNLVVGRKEYDKYVIDYLEIDGRVLKDGG